MAGDGHYGSRLAFRADGTLFVTLGERMYDDPSNPGLLYAQNVANHLGKVVRINRDGSVPADNPNLGVSGALPELWSYIGHFLANVGDHRAYSASVENARQDMGRMQPVVAGECACSEQQTRPARGVPVGGDPVRTDFRRMR